VFSQLYGQTECIKSRCLRTGGCHDSEDTPPRELFPLSCAFPNSSLPRSENSRRTQDHEVEPVSPAEIASAAAACG